MTLDQLIALFRVDVDDRNDPPFWSDEAVTAWFDEAQQEAAIRADLLPEVSDDAICLIATTANVHTYSLNEAVTKITHAQWLETGSTCPPTPLALKRRQDLDAQCPNWRTLIGEPEWLVLEQGKVRLAPTPTEAGALRIECFRLPLDPLTDLSEPEIQAVHHRHLVHWPVYRAFSIPDADHFDEKRAGEAEARFTAHFGPRVDADLKRTVEVEQQFFNKVWL